MLRSSYTFEAKTQPISLPGSSPARAWFDIKDVVEICVEVNFTKLKQLRVFKVFQPVIIIRRVETGHGWHSQQDSTILTPNAFRCPQVLARETPHSVTDIERILCVVCSIASRVRCHVR